MPRNTMTDLQNILFEELEKLSDDEIMEDPEKRKAELARAHAIKGVANVAVINVSNAIRAKKIQLEYGERELDNIPLIGGTKPEEIENKSEEEGKGK